MGVVNDLHNLRMDMISALSNPQYDRNILETLDELAAGLNGNSCALERGDCSSIYLGSGEYYTIILGIKAILFFGLPPATAEILQGISEAGKTPIRYSKKA